MAFASVGTFCGSSSIVSSTTLVTPTTVALAVGELGVIVIASDNINPGDGDFSEITSVTDDAGNIWIKAGEATRGSTSADNGCTASVWYTRAVNALAIGANITITFAGAIVAKAVRGVKFTVSNPVTLATGSPKVNYVTAVDFGSAVFSGLSSKERLYFRGGVKEHNTNTALTPTSGYTATGQIRADFGTVSASVLMRGEFRILTGTGDTSNPVLAASSDTASVFIAFEESVSNNAVLNATEALDTVALAVDVIVTGTFAASAALDTASFTVTVLVKGALASTEALDTAAFAGTSTTFASLAASEALDVAAFTGKSTTFIALAVSEPLDVAALTGAVLVKGPLASTESLDTAAFTGAVVLAAGSGVLQAIEAPDTAAFAGTVLVKGQLVASEALDTAALTGDVIVKGQLVASESLDTAALAVDVIVKGSLAASEALDTAALAVDVIVKGLLTSTEAPDTAAFSGIVAFTGVVVHGNLQATEQPDIAALHGSVTTFVQIWSPAEDINEEAWSPLPTSGDTWTPVVSTAKEWRHVLG